ncbi:MULTISPECIES: hypothetical protein [unclassified Variovorax]|uniref:hypothetical protein n=1 Tax=unclassified Variovorax TaxID=663243 RepID=UPI003F449081
MTTSLRLRFARLTGQQSSYRAPRGITRNGHRVRGIFASTRFNCSMQWESSLQWDLMYRLEASWLVADACSRPAMMSIILGDGTSFRYTPHAVAMRRDELMVCLECVPDTQKADRTLAARHTAIRTHLAGLDVLFQAVSEAQLHHPVARTNARTLAQALRSGQPSDYDVEDCRRLAKNGPTTFYHLEKLLGRAASLRMLASGHAYFDVHQHLGATTPLTFDLQEHFDAADFIYA